MLISVDSLIRQETIDLLKPLGNRIIREDFRWDLIEPQKGVFHWKETDELLAATENTEIEILALLMAAPDWASDSYVSVGACPPKSVQDYANFVASVVQRYKGRIKYYELWNEPNIPRFWGGRRAEPAEFIALLKAGYQAGKHVDPNAIFVMGGITNLIKDNEFMKEVIRLGGLQWCDIIGIHAYPRDVETFARTVDSLTVLLDRAGSDKKIWVTEIGWSSRELDMKKFSRSLEKYGINRKIFRNSVALRRSVGWVYGFSAEELRRAQNKKVREQKLKQFGLTEGELTAIIYSCEINQEEKQIEEFLKLAGFIQSNGRIEKVIWYNFMDKFDMPIKEGNWRVVDCHGNPKPVYKAFIDN